MNGPINLSTCFYMKYMYDNQPFILFILFVLLVIILFLSYKFNNFLKFTKERIYYKFSKNSL